MAHTAPALRAADIIRRSPIAPAMPRPLSHIRVLDLSRVLAGPWASQNLADLGAEVIKVERPGSGDDTRSWGPPFLKDKDGKETRESAYFLSVNRGKKSVTLDLSKPEGQRIARALAAKCDVLLENYKVGGLAKYGLAYEDLRKINPRIIYCSITGAIAHRERTGVGQYIDLALFDAVVAFGANQILNYFTSGKIPGRYGNAHANVVPYEVFATADGHLILAVGNDSQFASFCRVADRPELAADPRYSTMPARITNRSTLIPLLREILRERPSARWLTELEAANVPCGPINNYKEVFEDPQVRHRGLRVEIPHPAGVSCPTIASPMRFSGTPVEYKLPPPLLGEHTREVLGELLGMRS